MGIVFVCGKQPSDVAEPRVKASSVTGTSCSIAGACARPSRRIQGKTPMSQLVMNRSRRNGQVQLHAGRGPSKSAATVAVRAAKINVRRTKGFPGHFLTFQSYLKN